MLLSLLLRALRRVLPGLAAVGAVLLLCVCVGSVSIPLGTTLDVFSRALRGEAQTAGAFASILLQVRMPRVLCAALIGASLSLCGAAMQGLLRNALADGSTLGVSSGASLGAAVAIVLGLSFPALPLSGTAVTAMLFAFASLAGILSLAYAVDHSLSTTTIILIGVVFSMLVSSLLSLLIAFSGEKLRSITFWTMGSLGSASYAGAALLAVCLALFGAALLTQSRALDAFALGEEQALHLGVNVRRVKLTVMIAVSALVGVCVSVGGGIGFVGLVAPHMVRLITGPDHRRLLPGCLFGGAVFLMLCDLAARTLAAPIELPIGVITSILGAGLFIALYARRGKGARGAC